MVVARPAVMWPVSGFGLGNSNSDACGVWHSGFSVGGAGKWEGLAKLSVEAAP
jgi:hypothetical protein